MDKISAFMDGESAPAEAQQTFKRLRSDEECLKIWNSYHLVGDVMRGTPMLQDDFLERLHQKMENEPTVLAPHAHWRAPVHFAYSAAAAVAGIAVVAALVMTNNPLRPEGDVASAQKSAQMQIAQGSARESRERPQAFANPAQVNEYLMAHQEFSPSTALQGVVPYVRTVSSSHDGSRR
jgi:sigma-E factor negative regulatory protein RseA